VTATPPEPTHIRYTYSYIQPGTYLQHISGFSENIKHFWCFSLVLLGVTGKNEGRKWAPSQICVCVWVLTNVEVGVLYVCRRHGSWVTVATNTCL